MILKAMQAGGLEEPNEASWYVFGRIAEQFGEYEAAGSAYRRLKAPTPEQDSPTATYYLAKTRLDLLAKEKKIKAR